MLRPARYVDSDERVELGELHVFTGPDFVVTVRHAQSPDIAAVRRRMEDEPELLARRQCSGCARARRSSGVGTVYGMNVDDMPELGWRYGYPMSLVMMLAVSGGLYAAFRRKGWL